MDELEERPAPLGRWRALRPGTRALVWYGLALAFGLLVVPFLIWLAGNRILGPYTHGQDAHAGPLALLADYFVGLAHGSAVFWGVALGPVVMLFLLRLLVRLWRAGARPVSPA